MADKQPTKEEQYGKISINAYKSNNWVDAFDDFKMLEEEGLGEASIAIGQLYQELHNKNLAFKHFQNAADLGIAEGLWGCAAILGHEYIADIEGKDRDWYDYCLRAAQRGCCDAMNEIGNMYHRINNYLASYYWYQMAGYYGHPQATMAAYKMVEKYKKEGYPKLAEDIDGVRSKDVKNALNIFLCISGVNHFDSDRLNEFFGLAMEDDNEIMGLFVGHFYEEVVKRDDMAKLGYQLAAHNNSIMGARCLADMQATGRGCEQNIEVALDWYKFAAQNGERNSCFVMGEFLRHNNPNLAAYYYSMSYRRGYAPALQRILQL